MRRALHIQSQVGEIGAIQDLTSVFESIASLRISQVKDKVTRSTAFFQQLWQMYTQLRIDPKQHLTKRASVASDKDRNAFIIVTSEGGLSGDIDQKIIERMLANYDSGTTDILVIGGHGAILLGQRGVSYAKKFALPDGERINVGDIIDEVHTYRQTSVFYEQYISLVEQSVSRIELVSAVEELSQLSTDDPGEIISSQDYVFEPSLEKVITYLESVMMGVALSQTILESRLAQYASRFRAMNMANEKAGEMKHQLTLEYHRAKRAESDERLKEIAQSVRGHHA